MDEGLVLVGKAAEQYITYKYVELFSGIGIIVFLIIAIIFGIYLTNREGR
jgi:ABC-type multidrug transport system permease subunit